MNEENTNREIRWETILRNRTAVIAVVIIAITAFSLGGLLLGGNGAVPESEAGHADSGSEDAGVPTVWTCSMHPQIRLPKPGKCPICFMDLIPVETGGGEEGLDPDQIRLSETALQLARILTTPVIRASASRSIRMVGKLAYDETRVSYITAWVPGRLDKLFIDYTGAEVSQGDRMANIYSPELIATQEELLQAERAAKALNGAESSVLKSTAEETLKSAREKLRLYGLSPERIDAIEREAEPSDHLTIIAPAGGVVVHKDAKEGMYVSTGTKIYTIADLSKLWVLLEAYESDLAWLRTGQRVTFGSSSFPGETFQAGISFIDPVVDPKTRTVEIRAIVDNRDGRLKPDMFVSGVVESRLDGKGMATDGDMESESFLIPVTAPLITGKRAIVYVQVPDQEGIVFEGREVTLGSRAGEYYVVRDGLEEGDEVVTNGAFKIDSELQIQAKPSMMSPREARAGAGHEREESGHGDLQEAPKDRAYKAGTAKRLENCEDARAALTPVYKTYFDVQMALANDDLPSATEAYKNLSETVSGVAMNRFEGEAHMRWMDISGSIRKAVQEGASAKTMEKARDTFYYVSQAMIELHDTFGHAGDDSVYLAYCPMARDHTGAYWLQEENIIWNSFYGAMMLRCGEIKKELNPGNAATE